MAVYRVLPLKRGGDRLTKRARMDISDECIKTTRTVKCGTKVACCYQIALDALFLN